VLPGEAGIPAASRPADRLKACPHIFSFLLAACMALASCTGASVPPERIAAIKDHAKSRGLIVGFEGLQPFSGFRIRDLVRSVGRGLQLVDVATTGNRSAHLPIIEEAARAGLPIYIVGYSMGGGEARQLAEMCKERNIPVRILFLLDPRYMASGDPAKVPDNVARAVFYTSTTYDIFIGTKPRPTHLANPKTTTFAAEFFAGASHTSLPSRVTDRVRKEIAADLEKCKRPAGPSTRPDGGAAKTQKDRITPSQKQERGGSQCPEEQLAL
jgi:hypothetical protein